jgi:hypothetical protein
VCVCVCVMALLEGVKNTSLSREFEIKTHFTALYVYLNN